MFVIFGWEHETTTAFGATLRNTCSFCGSQDFLQLTCKRTWLTIFFVPVLPYESLWSLTCPQCSQERPLHGDEVAKAKRLQKLTAKFLAKAISSFDYELEGRRILS